MLFIVRWKPQLQSQSQAQTKTNGKLTTCDSTSDSNGTHPGLALIRLVPKYFKYSNFLEKKKSIYQIYDQNSICE